jgi:hypothetical protein
MRAEPLARLRNRQSLCGFCFARIRAAPRSTGQGPESPTDTRTDTGRTDPSTQKPHPVSVGLCCAGKFFWKFHFLSEAVSGLRCRSAASLFNAATHGQPRIPLITTSPVSALPGGERSPHLDSPYSRQTGHKRGPVHRKAPLRQRPRLNRSNPVTRCSYSVMTT